MKKRGNINISRHVVVKGFSGEAIFWLVSESSEVRR
jgi:hypothetical protein